MYVLQRQWIRADLFRDRLNLGEGVEILKREANGRGDPGLHSEPRAIENPFPKLLDGDSLQWVTFEDPPEDRVQLGREGKDGCQKVGVLEIRPKSGILGRGPLPRIATTGQVDQNHAQGPDIVRRGEVTLVAMRSGLLAL